MTDIVLIGCANGTNSLLARVGVISGMTHADLDKPGGANVYLTAGAMQQAAFVVVRTTRPMGDVAKEIRRAIAAIDPNQPVFLSTSMATLVADSVSGRKFILTLLGATPRSWRC